MEKNENPWLSLTFNIAIPAIILSKFSDEEHLGPIYGLIVGLSFPLAFGVWDLWDRRKLNFVSVLGVVSVLLGGGMGLLKVDGLWFAVKEAVIPGIIGAVVFGLARWRYPVLKNLVFNDKILECGRVSRALQTRNNEQAFDQLLVGCFQIFALSFFISAALNYLLARWILVSPVGTVEFNAELGKMTALSYPVIVLPSMAIMVFALWRMVAGIKKLTGLPLEEIVRAKK